MQSYETIFIVPVETAPHRLDELIEKTKDIITKPGGEIVGIEKWGRRRLAYPIRRNREGFYVLVKFKSPPGVPAEINQFYHVTDEVIRHLTCKGVRTRGVSAVPVPASAVAETVPATVAEASGQSSVPEAQGRGASGASQ